MKTTRSALRPACYALLLFLTACRSVAPFPPVNLSAPGWTVRHGQAVWQPRKGALEIAGELQLATHTSGDVFVQFTKNPLPLVLARTRGAQWQIQFVPQKRTLAGTGAPTARVVWLQLPPCLRGDPAGDGWSFTRNGADGWRMENASTGESLSGFLGPP
ncbi:MAG: hypothetical protein AB1705_05905 [Verrucomicrobiota bacterium]